MFLCFSFHLFAPFFKPFCFVVKKLHEPAAVPPEGGHSARICALQTGFHQPWFRLWAGGPTGGTVVLSVTKKALCAHSSDSSILSWCAGLRMASEGATELQAFVLHGGKAFQLQVCLNCSCHTVRTLEPSMPRNDDKGIKYTNLRQKRTCIITISPALHTVFYLPPGSLWSETEEGLYFQRQSLVQFPPGNYNKI